MSCLKETTKSIGKNKDIFQIDLDGVLFLFVLLLFFFCFKLLFQPMAMDFSVLDFSFCFFS